MIFTVIEDIIEARRRSLSRYIAYTRVNVLLNEINEKNVLIIIAWKNEAPERSIFCKKWDDHSEVGLD